MSSVVVDVGRRLVTRDGIETHLSPKAFDLLVLLVSNRPNAVAHVDLHEKLWPAVHISETSLSVLVTQLRKALGDTEGRLIRTLHRVGYAFIGDAIIVNAVQQTERPVCRIIWRGKAIEVLTGESMIGRDPGCAVYIEADSVSRRHAKLSVCDGLASIEDLGSKNGTWISGERIQGTVNLADGSSIRLGSENVRFEFIGLNQPTKTVTRP